MIAQWLCMTEVDGIRAIFQWPSVSAFIAYLNPLSIQEKHSAAKLVVAVLSRLEHFERRKVIRSTWKKLKNPDTSFFFVMPEQPCPIDPSWRRTAKGWSRFPHQVSSCSGATGPI